MISKKKIVGVALVAVLISGGTVFAAGESCTNLLNTTCLGCHENERICEKIGKSARYWKATLDLMISNGTEISDDEFDTLKECLSQSLPEAKAVCKK